jgi:hypothetical protein
MTTIPGHNIIIQQSGTAQEMLHQTNTPKPSPEQAVAVQAANALVKNTTVQTSEESERLKTKKEKDALRKKQLLDKKRNKKQKEEMDDDPETTGRLLDTTV